ncbi:LysM peptidoglycan-binding domain-containing protein [Microbacterium sp. SSW1-49]|uniref:LysM peptidoglycan-binding domain-containing protein n=1 Tax=Microbacterium croceum TaxID=2851645 RepID=A0ABT0FGK3_9MICO|nr:LysM peptidoglycan-binding domain-containing protein [Microbacterium croceum]
MPAAVLGALAGTLAVSPAAATQETMPLERLHGSARLVPAQSTPTSYVVRAGDTISSIAARHGLRTVDVLTWNGLSWRSVIYPGQTLALAAPAAVAAPAPRPAAPSATRHTVVAGDTVFGVAQKYGTTVDAVLAANGLTRTSIIYPGQKLAVSGAAAPAAAAAPAPAAPATAASSRTHKVVAGDTVFAIAKKYGTTTSALFALNGLQSSSIIYPGQTLVVQQTAAATVTTPAPQLASSLDAEQAATAALIIRIGRELGVSDRGIAIALATGMVESGLRNLDWGDRDSLGIFQQRPSTGWGTPAQVQDADRSTRVFYGGRHDPNGTVTRGLLDIPGWEKMSFTDAAQAVQISAYPDKYGRWETQAYQWLVAHG